MNLLIESQYLAPVIAYKKSIEVSNIKFDVYDAFRKMSFRNRCLVAGSHGPILLTVPLEEGRDQRRPMKEVRIANRLPWQSQHWKTIMSCYNRSPWFEFYRDDLEPLYQRPFEWLVDWNLACWNWVTGKLGMPVSAGYTDHYQAAYPGTEYIDWRNRLIPKSMLLDFPEPVRYRQVFEERVGFIPHCSILDLLFCEGKNTVTVLKRS